MVRLTMCWTRRILKKTFRLSREIPEVLSSNASEEMVENEDTWCNLKHAQDAFVFCPTIKSVEIDTFCLKAFFLVKKKCPKWKTENNLFSTNSPTSFLRGKMLCKVKCKWLQIFWIIWNLRQQRRFLFVYNCHGYFQFWKRYSNRQLATQQCRKFGRFYNQSTFGLASSCGSQ